MSPVVQSMKGDEMNELEQMLLGWKLLEWTVQFEDISYYLETLIEDMDAEEEI